MDRIEVDVNITADGQLIIVHDETINPDIVRQGPNWAETPIPWFSINSTDLPTFDIGRLRPHSHYQQRFSEQQSIDGTRIPTLEELSTFIKSLERSGPLITLEIKYGPTVPEPQPEVSYYAKRVIDTIERLDLQSTVTLQSFNWSIIKEMQKLAPNLIYGCLTSCQPNFDTVTINGGNSPWTAGLNIKDFGFSMPKMVKAMGVSYWCSEHKDLTIEKIEEARELNLDVYAWTVNQSNDMKKLLAWSVDSIITDYPEKLAELVERG